MADSSRIDDLRRRVQKDPASIAFAQLAEECRRAGLSQESVDVCRAGLELHPGYLSARVTLGRALLELNDLDAGLVELEHVLKSAPENLAAIRALAEIYHRKGLLAEALTQYRAALVLARNDPDLQQTVNELAHKVEPPPPAADSGLSFEQAQDEFLKNLAPPPAAPPPLAVQTAADYYGTSAPAPVEPVAPEPEPAAIEALAPLKALEPLEPVEAEESPEAVAERAQALQLIAVLEQWLGAIHVARAQPRA